MPWEVATAVDMSLVPEGMAVILVDGSTIYEKADGSFVDVVRRLAREAGLGKTRVFAGDTEVYDPDDAPATLGEAEQPIRITRYDSAG